jgi:hypothetical protein
MQPLCSRYIARHVAVARPVTVQSRYRPSVPLELLCRSCRLPVGTTEHQCSECGALFVARIPPTPTAASHAAYGHPFPAALLLSVHLIMRTP